jgi:pyridoxine 5-phosphate synthase
MVEIHTGGFCGAETGKKREKAFSKIQDAAKLAYRLKMGVNAGHGLCYQTITYFRGLDEISEFSIGHSIVSRAVLVGMERAVREMIALIKEL